MAAPDTTKYQVNYKLSDGTLINLYATTVKELETGLNDLSMVATLIKSTATELGGGSSSAPSAASVAASLGATVVSTPTSPNGSQEVRDRYGNLWVYNHPEAPDSARGRMVLKHGTAQATGKPYKGWFDPAAGPQWSGPKVPKEQQIQTIWA